MVGIAIAFAAVIFSHHTKSAAVSTLDFAEFVVAEFLPEKCRNVVSCFINVSLELSVIFEFFLEFPKDHIESLIQQLFAEILIIFDPDVVSFDFIREVLIENIPKQLISVLIHGMLRRVKVNFSYLPHLVPHILIGFLRSAFSGNH